MKRLARVLLWLLLIELALMFWWTWRLEHRALGPPYYLGARDVISPAISARMDEPAVAPARADATAGDRLARG